MDGESIFFSKAKIFNFFHFRVGRKIVLRITSSGESIGTLLLKGRTGCKGAIIVSRVGKSLKIRINSFYRQGRVFVNYAIGSCSADVILPPLPKFCNG